MGVLRRLWSGVLAFDRIGSRIPQLVQIWLVELGIVLPLAFFVARVIDIRGAGGIPGTGENIEAGDWVLLGIAAVCGFFFLRSVFRPRLVEGEWTPLTHVPVGDVEVLVPNRSWTVGYTYLTSHPSYSLLLLLTLPIPAVMVLATENQGGSTFYLRMAGWAGLGVIAAMVLIRLVAWYVLRVGRAELDQDLAESGQSLRRVAWEVAWKPLVMLLALVYGIGGIPIGVLALQEVRTIRALPVAAVGDERVGEFVRVVGRVRGEPVFWAPRGTGRGGNNYSGAAQVVDLDTGGEVVLFAEALSVPDLVGVLEDVEDGRISTHGRVIDRFTENQTTYDGFALDDLPPPDPDGRILVLHSYP